MRLLFKFCRFLLNKLWKNPRLLFNCVYYSTASTVRVGTVHYFLFHKTSQGFIWELNTRALDLKKKLTCSKKDCHITPNLANEKSSNLAYFGAFLWFSLFLEYFPFLSWYYIWMESSCNEDSDATFHKSLGGTSKRLDCCDGHGREVWSIAEGLS